MAKVHDIHALLKAAPSDANTGQLLDWIEATRDGISRGDMMLGILSMEDVAKIPAAYRKAAEQGKADAWLKLAWWHARPDYGAPDLEEAENAMRQAIEAGVLRASLERVKLRWLFRREAAKPKEKKDAYQTVSALVASDPKDSEALYYLAILVTHGFGTKASPEEGFRLQQQAADLGNSDAMFELYIHHAMGLGTPADDEAALKACRRAADAGHARGMYNMGAFHASGRGVPKNIPEAIKWYELAADAGNPSAYVGLAVIYGMGDGVEPDRAYAEQLFDQADFCGLDVSDLRKQMGI